MPVYTQLVDMIQCNESTQHRNATFY